MDKLLAEEQKLRDEHTELTEALSKPNAYSQPDYADTARRHSELSDILPKFETLRSTLDQIKQAKEILDDPELGILAKEELPELEATLNTAEEALKTALIPKDPNDHKKRCCRDPCRGWR